MKKLMICAAVAALSVGAFAEACSDVADVCRAWDISMSLKSFKAKKTSCKASDATVCDDASDIYYLDNGSRKIKGYLWVCEYECGKAFNIVLWDSKHKKVVIPVSYDAVEADDIWAYGKKATKVAGTLVIEGTNLEGEDTIAVTASGVSGKMVRGKADEDCYVKSLSGHVTGNLAWYEPTVRGKVSKGGLCEEPVEEVCADTTAKILSLCDACCFTNWCDEDVQEAPEMLPTVGTWKMKYNKSVSKGNKTIAQLVPAYAL